MNKYLKNFLHRGLIFAGFGPIVAGIVFFVISLCGVDLALSGLDILLAILSTYILAFVQAGVSVFNQIEEWPLAKSLFFHFLTLYLSYSLTYIVNSWIPFEPSVLLIFTAIFIVAYLVIWLTVYFSVKAVSKKLNNSIN